MILKVLSESPLSDPGKTKTSFKIKTIEMSNRMEVRAAICGLAEAQKTAWEISRILKVARSTVIRTLNKKKSGKELGHDVSTRKK